nr:immunoglobulin light chain junction region [Macaca mulatta]
LQQHNSYPRTF